MCLTCMLLKGTGRAWLQVHLTGKPDPIIYDAAREQLDVPTAQLIAVGDSLEHDIAGAASAGVDSVFVGGGIHAAALGLAGAASVEEGAVTELQTVASLCDEHSVPLPTFATQLLVG